MSVSKQYTDIHTYMHAHTHHSYTAMIYKLLIKNYILYLYYGHSYMDRYGFWDIKLCNINTTYVPSYLAIIIL